MKNDYFQQKLISNPSYVIGGNDDDNPNDDLGGNRKKKKKSWFGKFIDWITGKK